MACCLTAPSHYLNECWLIISENVWLSPEVNFTGTISICDMILKIIHLNYSHNELTHCGRDKMAAIFQTIFSSAFSWMEIYKLRLIFHWNLFPVVQLTIFQHWFRKWLGAVQATSHYLNQWWLDYWRIYASLGLNELKMLSGFVVNCGVSLLRTSSDYEVGRIMKTTLEGFRLAGFFIFLQVVKYTCLSVKYTLLHAKCS